MSPSAVLGFAAASIVIVAVPGPSVLLAVSRAVACGRRMALLTVLGNASGLFVQVVIVALGLGLVVAGWDLAFTVLKIAGAAWLVWLGVSALRHRPDTPPRPARLDLPGAVSGPWRDGFLMGVTNPKSAVFLAALLPQYVDPLAGPAAIRMVALGALFCLLAVAGDGLWALLAASARPWLADHPHHLTWVAVAGGVVMMVLGLSLLAA
jgi:threonine/homoserine/homoserine lactone efflux protein